MKGFQCSACGKDSSLRCKVCKVAFYCGRECQTEDHEKHKESCKSVKKLTDTINREKAVLLSSSDVGFFTDRSVNFWEHREAHLYMRTRVLHFNKLDDIGTEYTLKEAIIQGKEMITEGKGHNPQVRYMIPSMYLRLNDSSALQECYDFMKSGDIHTGNYALELVNRNSLSNMCESLYISSRADLYNVVALTIIKMRLLLSIEQYLTEFDLLLKATIRTSSSIHIVGGNQGVLISVSSFLLPPYACFANKKIAQLRMLRTKLSAQVQKLLGTAERSYDDRIWKILVNPSKLKQPQSLRFPSNNASRILTVSLCYIPFFTTETKTSRAMRQILVNRVGEAPYYHFTLIQATVLSVALPP